MLSNYTDAPIVPNKKGWQSFQNFASSASGFFSPQTLKQMNPKVMMPMYFDSSNPVELQKTGVKTASNSMTTNFVHLTNLNMGNGWSAWQPPLPPLA